MSKELLQWFNQNTPVSDLQLDEYCIRNSKIVTANERRLLMLLQFERLEDFRKTLIPGEGPYSPGKVKVSPNTLHKIYGFTREQVIMMFQILRGEPPKVNTLCFWGPSNCGKTLLVRALCAPFMTGYIARDSGVNVHWLSNCMHKNLLRWEEPIITFEIKEDLKLILGGEPIAVNEKNKPIVVKENRTPVLMSTNIAWWMSYNDPAYLNRMLIVNLHRPVESVTHENICNDDINYYLSRVYAGDYRK